MESIIQLISKIPQDSINDLIGSRSRKAGENILDSDNFLWISKKQNQNSLVVVYQAGSEEKKKVEVVLRWSNRLLLESCSCDKKWRPGQKLCSHAAVVLLGITEDDLFFEETEKAFELPIIQSKSMFSKIQIETKQIERAEKIISIDYLKLDNSLVVLTLQEIQDFLESLVQSGLQRISQATLEWTTALVIKARISKLINLEKELKRLSDLLIRYIQKNPDIKSSEFLNRLSRIQNLIYLTKYILKEPHPTLHPIEIIGTARTEYLPRDNIVAQTLGIKGWISDTGFVGITAYFIELKRLSENYIFTASMVRPLQYLQEKSPLFLYHLENAGISFQEFVDSCFEFQNVKLNINKNLSFYKDLMIVSVPEKRINVTDVAFNSLIYKDWIKLIEKVQNKQTSPIDRSGQFSEYVILEPFEYSSFELDPVQQEWQAPLYDRKRRQIMLIVPNQRSPHIANKILSFQRLFEENHLPNALFGELRFTQSKIVFNPISGYYYQGIRLKKSWRQQQRRWSAITSTATQGTTDSSLRLLFNFDLDPVQNVIFPESISN